MYQPQELFNNLSPSEISRTLRLSGILEKELYTEDDADRFRECRTLIEQGGTDEDVMALLSPVIDVVLSETQDNSLPEIKNSRKKSGKKAANPLDITELLIAAREQGLKLTLTQASRILAFCGLTDKEEYTQQEVERFIQASGFVGEETPDISSSIGDISTESEAALAGLVDRVTDYLAEKIPKGLVKDLYAQKAIAKLGQQSQGSDDLFAQLEDKIIQQLEGKSQTQTPLQQLLEKHRVFSLPPTSYKLMELPSESESDTTTS